MAASLLGLGLFLGGARAPAQDLSLPPIPPLPPPAFEMAPPPTPLPPGAATDLASPPVSAPAPMPAPPDPATRTAPPPVPTPAPAPPREKTLHFSREPMPVPTTTSAFPGTATTNRLQSRGLAFQGSSSSRTRDTRKEQQAEESVQYTVPLEPPGAGRLLDSPLKSDADLLERIRQEKRSQSVVERIVFPEEVPLSKVAYAGRQWLPLHEAVEPGYVIYRRLLFEQKNCERYGWDVGMMTPALCALRFYGDVVAMPYHLGARPFQQFDSSAGHCLPGDPVPLQLYPPEWSATGLGLEAAVLLPLFFAFP